MFELPVKMQHLSLTMMKADAPAASVALASLEVIHLIETNASASSLSELPAQEYQQVYQQLHNHFKKIVHYQENTVTNTPVKPQAVSMQTLQAASDTARGFWRKISVHEENIHQARESLHTANQLTSSLSRFENLNVDLGKLSSNSLFIKIFVGTVPHSEMKQLERALSLANTVIDVFHKAELHNYVTVVTEIDHEKDIQEILHAAGFHDIDIPPELHNRPEQIKQDIAEQVKHSEALVAEELKQIKALLDDNREAVDHLQQVIANARPYAMLSASLSGEGQLVYLEGWAPAGREASIQAALNEQLDDPFLVEFRDPKTDELPEVPTLQKQGRLLKPFQALVGQYGVPEYGEIDPTKLFLLTYTLMFGMMFGDIGHGAAIILIGFVFRNKLRGLLTFTTFIGLSSIAFGFIYGSVFGYHALHPIWMSPMDDPNKLLISALIWGIGFLVMANLLSIRNLFALNRAEEAVYSNRGIVGLVFFLGSIFAGYQFIANGQFGTTELLAIFVPLGVMLYKHWHHIDGNVVEKALIVVIEGLDNIINTLSSTLSFLRIAAFALNHVALAAAVFTLAGMMDTFGHWVTVILGNIFIIVLEGGIVAIQCLRLEYYEGFSRFFSGKGKLFKPLKIDSNG